MHELNICFSIINSLEQRASNQQLLRISKVWLEVGALAGIELDALRFSFPIAAKGSIASQASLEIISIAGNACCNKCKNSFIIKTLFDPCCYCDSYDYQVTQGKELRILKMEVE